MKFHLILYVVSILTACNENKEIYNFTVTTYQRVDEGYQYSKDLIAYDGNIYKPIVSSHYKNNTLTTAVLYKPEGKIRYSKDELRNDSLFTRILNLPEIRMIEIKGQYLLENENSRIIDKKIGDSLFCVHKNKLLLYNIQ